MVGGVFQIIAEFGNIQKGQVAAVGHAQGDVQVPQTHIAVNAEHPFAPFGQGGGNPGTDGGLPGAAFSRDNGIQFAQTNRSLP